MQPLIPPPLFFFPLFFPAAAVHHKQDPVLARSLAATGFLPRYSFFVFLLLATLPLLTDTEMTNVYPLERLRRPLSLKTRQLDKLVAVHPSGPALELL